MSDQKIFLSVKKYIDQMDYYNLLACGAPNDEFDCESREICKRIHVEQSVQEIAEVIADVFNSNFNENDDSVIFLSVAEKIKKETIL